MAYRSAIGAVVLTSWLAMGLAAAPAQDMSRYPDWSGQWKKPNGLGNGQWDPTKPTGRAQEPPLTAEYQALYETRLAERAAGGLGGDPTAQCIPHGMPRMMIGVYPMELVVTPKTTYMLSDYNEPRRIHTDGREMPADEPPTFAGYSVGKWLDTDGDGRYDTLEVETRNFKGPRTYEPSGIPLHADNETVIKERFSLDQADKDLMHNEITVIDNALTRPWTVTRGYVRNPDPRPDWPEFICAEGNGHVAVGKENYFLSADGFLMPTRKGQAPPDARYFK